MCNQNMLQKGFVTVTLCCHNVAFRFTANESNCSKSLYCSTFTTLKKSQSDQISLHIHFYVEQAGTHLLLVAN